MAKKEQTKALTLTEVNISKPKLEILNARTPEQFIKTRPIRGGQQARYIEVGYVIKVLNLVFGPLNWGWKIIERGETSRKVDKKAEGEVWVYGELTVYDHIKGYSVTKGANGQHPIYPNVPYGDALKSAGSDAMKKAASFFGVGLDVYWQYGMDDGNVGRNEEPDQKADEKTLFENSKRYIERQNDPEILKQLKDRLESNEDFTLAQKIQLKKLIDGKLAKK